MVARVGYTRHQIRTLIHFHVHLIQLEVASNLIMVMGVRYRKCLIEERHDSNVSEVLFGGGGQSEGQTIRGTDFALEGHTS